MSKNADDIIHSLIFTVVIITVVLASVIILVHLKETHRYVEFELLEYHNKSGKVIVETDRIESIQKIIDEDEKIVAISTKNGEWHMVDYSYDEVKDMVGW